MEEHSVVGNDGAVSPVIGVILMIVITVLLAAIVAAFLVNIGDTNAATPQASFQYAYDESTEELTITVDSGGQFEAGQVTFEGVGFDMSGQTWAQQSGKSPDSAVASGDRVTLGDGVAGSGTDVTPAYELEIVWEAPSGTKTATLSERTGPGA